MHDTQTIDQHDELDRIAEQRLLLDRITDRSDRYGTAAWSDDHGLHVLMQRYEESVSRVA